MVFLTGNKISFHPSFIKFVYIAKNVIQSEGDLMVKMMEKRNEEKRGRIIYEEKMNVEFVNYETHEN